MRYWNVRRRRMLAVLCPILAVVASHVLAPLPSSATAQETTQPAEAADGKAPPRSRFDRVPIFGWLGLRREAELHGPGFWVRPLVVELAAAFGLAWLYLWEVADAGLLASGIPRPVPPQWQGMLHVQFTVHALLVWLMLVASLIDVDEKTIPDGVTVPGALVGLLLAALYPLVALPDWCIPDGMVVVPDFWQVIKPEQWPTMTLNSPTPPDAVPGWPGGAPLRPLRPWEDLLQSGYRFRFLFLRGWAGSRPARSQRCS